jgi:bifunctional DNase/RNase
MEKIELNILGLTVSQSPDSYIILLKDKQSSKRLPIIVGSVEAQSIAVAIDNLHPPRPLTHDVFFNIMVHYGIELKEVYIYNIINGVFHAQMICERHTDIHSFEVRSSDAIAMALRFNVPIFTNKNVLKMAGVEPVNELPDEQTRQKKLMNMSAEELRHAIENAVKTEDYETASLLRDLLKKKNNPLSSG